MATIANPEARWYVLGDAQQNYGPYTLEELQDHFASGYLTGSSLLWADGRPEWCPLSAIDELKTLVASQNPRTRQTSLSSQQVKDPLPLHTVMEEDDFLKWQEEIRKAEEEQARLKSGKGKGSGKTAAAVYAEKPRRDPVGKEEDRPATPPQGEREFTDDDGTTYRWDFGRKVWVPQGEAVVEAPVYHAEEMVFDVEEEVFPTIASAIPNEVEEPVAPSSEIEEALEPEKKRKQPESEVPSKPAPNNNPEGWFELKVNTHVYVTGLPDDVTIEESNNTSKNNNSNNNHLLLEEVKKSSNQDEVVIHLRMDGNKEEGSSSEDRQPTHEIGESSGQVEEALQSVTAVTMFKQLMENPRTGLQKSSNLRESHLGNGDFDCDGSYCRFVPLTKQIKKYRCGLRKGRRTQLIEVANTGNGLIKGDDCEFNISVKVGPTKKKSSKKYFMKVNPKVFQGLRKAGKGKALADSFGGQAKKWKRPFVPKFAEEKKVLIIEGKCFISEQPGHIASDCPQKKRPADSYDKEDRKGKKPKTMAGLVSDVVGDKPNSDASELCRAWGKVRD
ncbi:hypothetical protein L7F22_026390 [Adiantum nelumboides]|nr:hypothetical protein [Adiantum nelumboides]